MNDHNGQLKSIVNRVCALEEEKKELSNSIKEIFAEAKSNGFDVAALKATVKISMEDSTKRSKREDREAIIETYLHALGELSDLPLGRAAIERAVA